jgi:ubiquinone/menaquinone biosynthesis C-methylase UbiE
MNSFKKINLLNTFPKVSRNIQSRKENKSYNRDLALKFDKEYFDGSREQGYGGYKYDGRWKPVATKLVSLFSLKKQSKFLDIGCAKGFLLYDLYVVDPLIDLYGLDISEYAKSNSPIEIRDKIIVGNCKRLKFPSGFFNGVVAINTVHNLEINDCINAINEIQRVSNGNAFIQVDAYRNDKELNVFKDWMLTAKTFLKPEEWLEVFKKANYTGYYDWTILEVDEWIL